MCIRDRTQTQARALRVLSRRATRSWISTTLATDICGVVCAGHPEADLAAFDAVDAATAAVQRLHWCDGVGLRAALILHAGSRRAQSAISRRTLDALWARGWTQAPHFYEETR